MNEKKSDFIELYSGRAFYFMEPTEEDFDIEDIAHTLSLLCRFGGHCSSFYSVADHSIRCSEKAPHGRKLEALLHDAAEAYIVDMPRPIKYALQGYRDIEGVIDLVMRKKFGLPEKMSHEVHLIDDKMLATERRDLMKKTTNVWTFLPSPYDDKIIPRTSEQAQKDFLNKFQELWEIEGRKVA